MDIFSLAFLLLILFLIIFWAVRLAVKPLITSSEFKNQDDQNNNEQGLLLLRNVGILTEVEYIEIIEAFSKKASREKKKNQFLMYIDVFNQLKEMDYFSDEQYEEKINKLKKYYKVD